MPGDLPCYLFKRWTIWEGWQPRLVARDLEHMSFDFRNQLSFTKDQQTGERFFFFNEKPRAPAAYESENEKGVWLVRNDEQWYTRAV